VFEVFCGGILVRSLSIDLKKIQKSVKKRQGRKEKSVWINDARGRKIKKRKRQHLFLNNNCEFYPFY